ncbi:MAG: Holliday junction branch migration protein RuvA, partial [Desulfovibrio sp.]|nr:Holliday junction branch migration protein RuvA [Desulfovibrio sp.]
MIAYLEGRLAEIGESGVVIVTPGGVGYEVEVPTSLLQSLPEVGSQCSLRTELLVRENELRLCGFATAED